MKITEMKSKTKYFVPFNVEIETEEEAKVFYSLLNNNGNIQDYWDGRGGERTRCERLDLKNKMWKTLDNIYTPSEGCKF